VAYGVHLGDTVGLNADNYVHYKAYIKTNSGWVEIDDAATKLMRPDEELSIRSGAYFCLYSIVDVKTSPTQQQQQQ
jgi:hypothetical protein